MSDGALGPGQSQLVALPSRVFFLSYSLHHLRVFQRSVSKGSGHLPCLSKWEVPEVHLLNTQSLLIEARRENHADICQPVSGCPLRRSHPFCNSPPPTCMQPPSLMGFGSESWGLQKQSGSKRAAASESCSFVRALVGCANYSLFCFKGTRL